MLETTRSSRYQNQYISRKVICSRMKNKEMPNPKTLTNKKRIPRPRNMTDYEKGHVELCKNSWQKDYTERHKLLVEKKQKFIIFSCSRAGWGNRLRELLSCFHFTVVSRRALIVECNFPSRLDKYLEPRHVKWNYVVNKTEVAVKRGRKIPLGSIQNASDPTVWDNMLNFSVEYSPALRGNFHQFLAKHVRYDIRPWPNIPQMMGCSFYYLFKKSGYLNQKLEEWKEKLGFYENIVIAIHIRMGDSAFHHNRGDKRFADMKEIDFSFNCSVKVEKRIEEKYKTKNIIWFLATDSEKIKSYAKEKYGNKVRHITGAIEHVGHPVKGNEDAGHLSMFLDYFLMQEADYRLYTGPSTFDDAIDFITLGSGNRGRTLYQRRRVCIMPQSLKTR